MEKEPNRKKDTFLKDTSMKILVNVFSKYANVLAGKLQVILKEKKKISIFNFTIKEFFDSLQGMPNSKSSGK